MKCFMIARLYQLRSNIAILPFTGIRFQKCSRKGFECIFIGGKSHGVKIVSSRIQRQYEKFDVFYHPRCMPAFENKNDGDLQFPGLTLELTELNLKYFHTFLHIHCVLLPVTSQYFQAYNTPKFIN